MLRKLRLLLIAMAALGVLSFSALMVIGKLYEDEVKAELVSAINAQLNAPVTVGGMDLTLIERFPKASMRLTDVLAREVRTDELAPDTLLHAKELFLEFSLWDLFRGNYNVEHVHGQVVKLYPGLDANGSETYIIWKTDTLATSSTIALDKVSFQDLQLRYTDGRSGIVIRSVHDELKLSGRFAGELNEMTLNGDAHLLDWIDDGALVIADRKAQHLRLEMSFGNGAFHINKGEVAMGKVPMELVLDLVPGKKAKELDLRANGLGLPLADVTELLPDFLRKHLVNYGMQGDVDLALRYSGPIDGDGPSLSVGAKLSRGRVKEKKTNTMFTDITGELALELSPKGTPTKLSVQRFNARSGSGSVSGNWRSNGLKNASLNADLKGDIALADLFRFAQIDTLEQVQGRLKADANVEGRLRDVGDLRVSDLASLKITGKVALRDASLKLKGARHRITHMDADLALQGNDAAVNGLKAEFHGNPIQLRGYLRNLVPYLIFNDQKLVIQAQGSSPNIDLAGLLEEDGPGGNTTNDHVLTLPRTIDLDLSAQVDRLVFEKFTATGITGNIRIKDRVLSVSPMSFSTANGSVTGDLLLDTRATGKGAVYPFKINARIQDIEMRELFTEFQDFGQDFIGHRHLKGSTDATITFNAPLSPDLKLDLQQLICLVDVSIENGSIKGHKPLLEVADHLQKNKLVAPFVNVNELRNRLADVRFSKLENQIEIRDGAVHIPTMEVKSTAMDLEISGTHWFDDRIDHHINFRLSDLFRIGKPAKDEFGPIVDDGTGMRIFLHMYGNAYDPEFANDGAMAAARRKEQFQQEKQELRSILQEELGLFKKKGTATPETTEEKVERPKAVIIIEDVPAPENGSTASTTATIPVEKPRKGLGRLLQEEEKPRERFVIEE